MVNIRVAWLCAALKGAPRYDVRIRGGAGHGKADVVREAA